MFADGVSANRLWGGAAYVVSLLSNATKKLVVDPAGMRSKVRGLEARDDFRLVSCGSYGRWWDGQAFRTRGWQHQFRQDISN